MTHSHVAFASKENLEKCVEVSPTADELSRALRAQTSSSLSIRDGNYFDETDECPLNFKCLFFACCGDDTEVDNGIKATDNSIKATDNSIKATDNSIKATDNSIKSTDNSIKATENSIKASDTEFKASGDDNSAAKVSDARSSNSFMARFRSWQKRQKVGAEGEQTSNATRKADLAEGRKQKEPGRLLNRKRNRRFQSKFVSDSNTTQENKKIRKRMKPWKHSGHGKEVAEDKKKQDIKVTSITTLNEEEEDS